MSDNRNASNGRKRRMIQISPMTRAVRVALAGSAVALALGGAPGAAVAASRPLPAAQPLRVAPSAIDFAPVADPTIIPDALAPTALAPLFAPLSIAVTDPGDVVIDNADPITASDEAAISGYSSGGNVDINNQPGADLQVTAGADAIGIYGYASIGDVGIDNAADITTNAYYGLADGIFASGANVDIGNSGTIGATSVYGSWAAGIEAQGSESTTVTNTGDITATAPDYEQTFDYDGNSTGYANGGEAFGIYVTAGSGGAVVDNGGNITATGGYATGIEVQSGGNASVNNQGDINAGTGLNVNYGGDYVTYSGTQVATGINVGSNGEGAVVTVDNSGDIRANGVFGGTGIAATASGTGGSASAGNSGSIYVMQATMYGTGAYGMVVSADGDASASNTGTVDVFSRGLANGITAISFAGDASVNNAGDVYVAGSANQGYNADGLVAFSANGAATVDNSGGVAARSNYISHGISAVGMTGATVSNSGTLETDGLQTYGIYAASGAGDVSVSNTDTGQIGFYTLGASGFGILGVATTGDVLIDNDGGIQGAAVGHALGLFGIADAGDVTIDNGGGIEVDSQYGMAMGVNARANDGKATVTNSGTIDAYSYGDQALGVLAQGDVAEVVNTGGITADGIYATAIRADGYHGATVTSTGGSIYAFAVVDGVGIRANAYEGDAVVDSATAVNVSARFGYATGLAATSAGGNARVDNSGEILAASLYGNATGIVSYSLGYDASLVNSGTVAAYSRMADATGISGFSGYGNVDIDNSGYIVANSAAGKAIGIYGYSEAGDVNIANTGDLYIESNDSLADGIFASGANVSVDNSGALHVVGIDWSAGIEAQGAASVAVTNAGDITAVAVPFVQVVDGDGNQVGSGSVKGEAFGIYASSEAGGASVGNSGNLSVDAYYATGIEVQAAGDITVDNGGDIVAGTGLHQYVNTDNGYTYYYGTAVAKGINATNSGEAAAITVTSSGDITANGIFGATGIAATGSGTGSTVQLGNTGTITVQQYVKNGYGAYGMVGSADGDSTVVNGGTITASSGGKAYGAVSLSFAGDAMVGNTGTIDITQAYYGYGAIAFANNGDASAINEGSISVNGYYLAKGMAATANLGDVTIGNSGSIDAYALGLTMGISGTSGAGDVTISNTGTISASSGVTVAVGIYGSADQGLAKLVNQGDITVDNESSEGLTGQKAFGVFLGGDTVDIGNTGNITVNGGVDGIGIAASSLEGTHIVSTGDSIYATAPGAVIVQGNYYDLVGSAIGIHATSKNGDTYVGNSSDITAMTMVGSAVGINAFARADVEVKNTGDISVGSLYGLARGIYAADILGEDYTGQAGTITISNSGDIAIEAPFAAWGKANGIQAMRDTGDIVIGNSGNIDIYAGGRSYGIYGQAKYGNVTITNSGDITMTSPTDAQIGIQAATGSFFAGGGDTRIINTGDIKIHSDFGFAAGIGAAAGSVQAPVGDSYIGNSGDVDVFGLYFASGIETRATDGKGTIVNVGDVNVETVAMTYDPYSPGRAVGLSVLSFVGGELTIQNGGDVTVNGYVQASGLYAKADYQASVAITNAGDVAVQSVVGSATGVHAYSLYGDIVVNNASSGSLDASGGMITVGAYLGGAMGKATLNNAGSIHAGDASLAAGVLFGSRYGDGVLNNLASGEISASGEDGYTFAVVGSDAKQTINNAGTITGAVNLNGGNDVFNNNAGGVWDIAGTQSTDFGLGDDTINNAAGGVIRLNGGSLTLGSMVEDSEQPEGQTFGFVPQAVELNVFNNAGTVQAFGNSHIDTYGGVFNNTGTVDFVNGATTDVLTLDGKLAGNGHMLVDADFNTLTADQLHVNGDVASGAVQVVDVRFTGVPSVDGPTITFARVSGTSSAGSFVGGQVQGYNQNGNFLSLGVGVISALDAGNTANDVFSIGLVANGLSDGGSLAANAASGAAAFLGAQFGTFRQRLGVNPYGDAGKVLSAFVRVYSEQSDINPGHDAGNFGQGGNFAYEQASWGHEFGINANLSGNFHAGVVLGNADSHQQLAGAGSGENRMGGMTFGAYATWYVPQGLYLDISGRWMAADIRSKSSGSELESRAHSSALSLEAGYEWSLGGVNVVPQAQYIRTKVDGVRTFHGELLDFSVRGGSFDRSRVGVEVNKAFQVGAIRWTPYGSVNAIRDSGGKTAYDVGGFQGETRVAGSRTMAELGLGVEKGGLGLTLGVNWTDGGSMKSFVGGQANLRYSW